VGSGEICHPPIVVLRHPLPVPELADFSPGPTNSEGSYVSWTLP
jgi:hypothetical protein